MYVNLEPPPQHHRYRVSLTGPSLTVTDAKQFITKNYYEYGSWVINTTGQEDTSDGDQIALCVELDWNSGAIKQLLRQEIAEITSDQVRVQLSNVPTSSGTHEKLTRTLPDH